MFTRKMNLLVCTALLLVCWATATATTEEGSPRDSAVRQHFRGEGKDHEGKAGHAHAHPRPRHHDVDGDDAAVDSREPHHHGGDRRRPPPGFFRRIMDWFRGGPPPHHPEDDGADMDTPRRMEQPPRMPRRLAVDAAGDVDAKPLDDHEGKPRPERRPHHPHGFFHWIMSKFHSHHDCHHHGEVPPRDGEDVPEGHAQRPPHHGPHGFFGRIMAWFHGPPPHPRDGSDRMPEGHRPRRDGHKHKFDGERPAIEEPPRVRPAIEEPPRVRPAIVDDLVAEDRKARQINDVHDAIRVEQRRDAMFRAAKDEGVHMMALREPVDASRRIAGMTKEMRRPHQQQRPHGIPEGRAMVEKGQEHAEGPQHPRVGGRFGPRRHPIDMPPRKHNHGRHHE